MSIIITNITENTSDLEEGKDTYLLRVNDEFICRFHHTRVANGLAQCLRDAADEIDYINKHKVFDELSKLMNTFDTNTFNITKET